MGKHLLQPQHHSRSHSGQCRLSCWSISLLIHHLPFASMECAQSLFLVPWTVFFFCSKSTNLSVAHPKRFFRIVILCGLNELNYDYGQGNPFFVGECGLCLDTKNNSFPGHTLAHTYPTIHGQTYCASHNPRTNVLRKHNPI